MFVALASCRDPAVPPLCSDPVHGSQLLTHNVMRLHFRLPSLPVNPSRTHTLAGARGPPPAIVQPLRWLPTPYRAPHRGAGVWRCSTRASRRFPARHMAPPCVTEAAYASIRPGRSGRSNRMDQSHGGWLSVRPRAQSGNELGDRLETTTRRSAPCRISLVYITLPNIVQRCLHNRFVIV